MPTPPVAPETIPLPIVTLNRAVLAGGVVVALVAQAPIVTTLLLAMLAGALLLGPRGSLVNRLGRAAFPGWVAAAVAAGHVEDRRLVRFNNLIAAALLAAAQLAFLAGLPTLGWVLAGMVALAAVAALAGFCLGCHLYPRVRYTRNRLAALRG